MSARRDKRDPVTVIGVAIVLIVAGAGGGAYWWQDHEAAREAREAAAALLAAADKARADQVRIESAAARAVADADRTGRLEQRTAQALERLASNHPMTQCDAALQLGRLGAREHTAALVEAMSATRSSSVRVCAASALVTLGERATALQAYTEWADGTDDTLRRAALSGFGEVGPSAAAVAIPHLTQALQSPYMDVRYLAVDSLSKLGAAAAPLLEQASKDTDPHVRGYAARALKGAAGGR
jgi:HEAT repeat protein